MVAVLVDERRYTRQAAVVPCGHDRGRDRNACRGVGSRTQVTAADRLEERQPAARIRPHVARPSAAVRRRRRVVALGLVMLAVTGIWIVVHRAPPGSSSGMAQARPIAERVWVVRPGDTLWQIAATTRRGGDLRPVVDRLVAEIGGRALQVGQRIPLPPGT